MVVLLVVVLLDVGGKVCLVVLRVVVVILRLFDGADTEFSLSEYISFSRF